MNKRAFLISVPESGLLQKLQSPVGKFWWCGLQNTWERLESLFQKNPRVRKIRVRNSGAGNGCANFMDTWKKTFFLQENLCP